MRLSAALVAIFAATASCLYEDQAGKVDWFRKNIGGVTHAAFHASGSNAPWLGGESSGQPPLKAALRPVRCGDSRLIPTSCNPGVSSRMGASVAELLRCRVSGLFFCDMCGERVPPRRRRRARRRSGQVYWYSPFYENNIWAPSRG